MPKNNPFQDLLRKTLSDGRISVTRIAKEVGVSRQTVHEWKDAKTIPKPDRVERFCAFIGVDPSIALAGLVRKHQGRSKRVAPAEKREGREQIPKPNAEPKQE